MEDCAIHPTPAVRVVLRTESEVTEMKQESIGQRVRRLRNDAGLLQRELADKIHCTHTTVRRIEADLGGCNMFTFIEIGRALNVSLDYLATGVQNGND
jgi:DNA-binding XRE family transcriptional regulator